MGRGNWVIEVGELPTEQSTFFILRTHPLNDLVPEPSSVAEIFLVLSLVCSLVVLRERAIAFAKLAMR